ncbi:MAG: RsiV family protein [Oscillospiraceae bacterium]
MKRLFSLLLSAALLLSLAACGGTEESAEPPADDSDLTEEPAAPFDYELVPGEGYTNETRTEDGVLVCTCRYSVPKLEAVGELDARQQASADAFNAAMEDILHGSLQLYDSIREAALADYDYRTETGLSWEGYYTDELSYTEVHTPRMVSLNFEGYTNSGGAYPAAGNVCYLFDLAAGELVTVEALTEDGGAAFRNALAEELLRQIAEQGLAAEYYDDYEATVRSQEEVQYFFQEDCVTVYFPDYTLAPHAAGYPTFTVPAGVYANTLSERGQQLFGFDGADAAA